MASETPNRIRMWSFDQVPSEFRELFPDGGNSDWVVYAPPDQRQVLEPSLLRWREVYSVRATELPDRSVVYWGAPRDAIRLIAERGKPLIGRPPYGEERRAAVRVKLECPSRYETLSEPKQAGVGHTIDMSTTGIAFTTESSLPANAQLTLQVMWPARLEGGVPVELHAAGRLARTEATMAALQLDNMNFSIAE
jgi:hypothetical protein